jgi:cytochrome c biogenesis factor
MNERWKYQIRTGLPFGIMMPVVMTAMDWYGTSFGEAFFSMKFLVKLIIFVLGGIFVIGYFNWREKQKNEMYNKN